MLDHVGVVVRELEPAVRFLEALGLQAGEPMEIEGEWVDAVNGLDGVRARMVWLSTPDGRAHVEVSTYLAPEYAGDTAPLPPNAPGLRHLTFRVPDLDAALAAVREQGFVPIAPPRRYEDVFRLVYLPGPEGLLVELAEPLDRTRLGVAPQTWRSHGLVLRPLTVQDAEADHAAVMDTVEQLRVWEGTGWPEPGFSVEENRAELADLQQRHLDRRACTYTVRAAVENGEGPDALGCVYAFPSAATFLARSEVSTVGEVAWEDVDVLVYFWVRGGGNEQAGGQAELQARLLAALRAWFETEWGGRRIVYVTHEDCNWQLDPLRDAGLAELFRLREPGKSGQWRVLG